MMRCEFESLSCSRSPCVDTVVASVVRVWLGRSHLCTWMRGTRPEYTSGTGVRHWGPGGWSRHAAYTCSGITLLVLVAAGVHGSGMMKSGSGLDGWEVCTRNAEIG